MLPIFTLAAPPRAQCLTALRRKVLRSQELPAARSCPPPGRNATPSLALRPPPRGVEKCFDGTVAKKRKPRAVPLLRLSAVPLPGAVPLLRKARAHDTHAASVSLHAVPWCFHTQHGACHALQARSSRPCESTLQPSPALFITHTHTQKDTERHTMLGGDT